MGEIVGTGVGSGVVLGVGVGVAVGLGVGLGEGITGSFGQTSHFVIIGTSLDTKVNE